MAVAGDVLELPEAGWTRYELSPYRINEYPQIDVFQETSIRIQTPGNSEDKIKIGSRIRIFGKITNPKTAGNQATSSMTTNIGTEPPTTIMQYPVMPLTDNEYTLIAEIELTDIYFPQDSAYIYFLGNTEYGYQQAVICYIDIEEKADPTPKSTLHTGIQMLGLTTAILNIASNENATAYYQVRESPTDNYKELDILEQPEAGWTRHKVSEATAGKLGDSGFEVSTETVSTKNGYTYSIFNKDNLSKIPVGTKIRVIGHNTNIPNSYTTLTKNVFLVSCGTHTHIIEKNLDVFPENTIIFEIEITEEILNLINNNDKYFKLWNTATFDKSLSAIDIVLPSPTPTELKVTHTGTIALTATVESQVEITGLEEDTGYDAYVVAEDENGNLQTTVTKIGFKTSKNGEEEEMKEILLGLLFLKLRVAGTTEWIELGDSKTEAKFKYEEKYADVKTVESGNVDKVLESTTTSIEVGISQVSKELIDKLSNTIALKTEGTAPNEKTYLEGGAGIGTVAPKFEVIAHPIEEGTTTEYDIYLPKATIETSIDKTGKAGDQLVFNLKIEALYDRTEKCKFRIGKNPA